MTTQATIYEGTAIERWIASGTGRAARVALGVGLISAALTFIARPAGLAVAAFGLVPIVTGAFNLRLLLPSGEGTCRARATAA